MKWNESNMRLCTTHLLLCLPALWIFAARSASGASEEPGAVLFHKGDNAIAWDNDELQRVRTLHARDSFKDKEALLGARSLGDYLGLHRVEALHMPVPLSIVFIGFAGDGNMHVNISGDELAEWFGHLDHVLPHTRVELAELTCSEDGHCTGLLHPPSSPPEPVPSYVHLNFSCNVVSVRRKAVLAAWERAIHAFSRPVDPEIEGGAQQVDAGLMEGFVNNFLDFLGLGTHTYTLLVINPTWSVSEPVYGYRLGMSQPELDSLMAQPDRVLKLLNEHYEAEPVLPHPYSGTSWMSRGGAVPRAQTQKFGTYDAHWNSDHWVTSIEHYLQQQEQYRKDLLKRVGNSKGAAAVVQAVRLLRRQDAPMAKVLREELLVPPDQAANIFSKFRTAHPAEDCMVGNWVGHRRWALVDLTAGGFDWGPALGGDGVVHKHTLPSVMERFTALSALRKAVSSESSTEGDKVLDAALEERKRSHVSLTTNRVYQAFLQELGRHHGAPSEPGAPPPTNPLDDPKNAEEWRRKYQETTLRAELDIYEEFAFRHCGGDATTTVACGKMREQAATTRRLLSKMHSAQSTMGDVWRDHKWDIFGPEEDHSGNWDVVDASVRAHDLFMAELNGVLSRALRHAIAPPTAVWTHAAGYLRDTATPYAPHVVFSVYVVSEVARTRSEYTVSNPLEASFDVDQFKQQVESLRLPTQHFDFHVHRLTLSEDPVLATAFAAAQRSTALEIPTSDDIVQETERVYVDSRALAHVLRQRFDTPETPLPPSPPAGVAGSVEAAAQRRVRQARGRTHKRGEAGSGSASHAVHEVPVFVFELQRDTAVLLDAHYNAKALEDMILVVTNAAREDEHPTGMMCGGNLMARPLSPLKEALGATLTHLGGVLPPHLGYDPARKRVTHDWLWSVGAHPHSFTSVGTQFTDLQRDALGRSYLLDGIDSAVDLYNAGVAALAAVPPSQIVYMHLKLHRKDGLELLRLASSLLESWRLVMEYAWSLDWGGAAQLLGHIEDEALKFKELAEKLANVPLGGQCAGAVRHKTEAYVLPTLVASVAIAASALGYLLLPALSGGLRVLGIGKPKRKSAVW